jgi:hypothetical protein
MKNHLMSAAALLMMLVAFAPTAQAISIEDCEGDKSSAPAGTGAGQYNANDPCAKTNKGLDKFTTGLRAIAGPLMGVVAVGFGLAWGLSGSNERMRETGKKGLLASVIGVALVFLADPIIEFTKGAFI